MNVLKRIDKTFKKVFQPRHPYIYHFRITKALTSNNVPLCIEKLREMRESKAPRIFALSVNVHSGSPVLAKTLRDAFIQTTSDLKAPLYTFAEDCALETGYYLLSAGHRIFANPYSLLGDVASTTRQVKVDKLVRKYVNVTLVKSGKYKNIGLELQETSPETARLIEKVTKMHHEDMIRGILESREINFDRKDIKPEQVKSDIMDGRTFEANEALEKGLIDGIMTFEEFKDKYYKDYNLTEYTIDKENEVGYEQITNSFGNWWNILRGDYDKQDSIMENYASEEIANKVELAGDMLSLLRSEKFTEKLRETISDEVFGEIYGNIQARMSMVDILEFLDNDEPLSKSILSPKF